MSQTTDLPKRADIPRESTWNADALFKDWGTWQGELENARSALPKLCAYSGKLSESADTLGDWLDLPNRGWAIGAIASVCEYVLSG